MSVDLPTGRPVPPVWKVALGLVVAALLVLGIGLLIARAAGFAAVRDAIEDADSTWFLACLVAQVAALGGYAVVVREAFRWDDGPKAGLGLSAQVMFASIGATRVLAAGGAGALAVAYWCFRKARFPQREALVRVLGFNALFYVVFGAAAWIAALLCSLGVWGDVRLVVTFPWLVLVPSCLAAAVFATQPGRVETLAAPGGSVARRGLSYVVSATAWVRELLPHRAGRRSLASSLVYWVGSIVCLWAALNSVGQSLPLPELVLAFATGHAAMILPLPLGGVGGVDAAMTYALTLVGVSLAPALVGVAVYRLFSFWVPTIPGLVALVLLPRAGRGLERAAAARA